jgi:ABC-type glycerol-3-phosphate transport system substrate-binding protein
MLRPTLRSRALILACASVLALGMAACQPQQQQAGQADPNRAPNPNAEREIDLFLYSEIKDMSVLDPAAQKAELTWFANAAAPYQGMEIKVVSETIATHEFESKVLAPYFTAITGIKVSHDLIGEGDVVEKLQTQMQSGETSTTPM